ncbi:MAG: hypothetical protein K0S82_1901 [Gaiellaceae bacterium]|nr:hypothetical protein [Gaiellaceae bacterium]
MTTRTSRTQPCDRAHARIRLDHAEKSLDVAELVAGEREIPESRSVAAALAVLAGIAASDAAAAQRSVVARAATTTGSARSRHSPQATPGDRAERFHGDRSQPPRGEPDESSANRDHRKSPVTRAFSVAGL